MLRGTFERHVCWGRLGCAGARRGGVRNETQENGNSKGIQRVSKSGSAFLVTISISIIGLDTPNLPRDVYLVVIRVCDRVLHDEGRKLRLAVITDSATLHPRNSTRSRIVTQGSLGASPSPTKTSSTLPRLRAQSSRLRARAIPVLGAELALRHHSSSLPPPLVLLLVFSVLGLTGKRVGRRCCSDCWCRIWCCRRSLGGGRGARMAGSRALKADRRTSRRF